MIERYRAGQGSIASCRTGRAMSAGTARLTSGRQELDKVTVIDFFHIGIFALHVELDPLGSPDAHALWLQLCQGNAAGTGSPFFYFS